LGNWGEWATLMQVLLETKAFCGSIIKNKNAFEMVIFVCY
jgi:hypothetical protein